MSYKDIHSAIVTGAASGIGARLTEVLAEAGAVVYAADVSPITVKGPNIRPVELDVRDPDAWRELVAEVLRDEGQVDLLANVAGVLRPAWGWAQSDDDVDFHIDVNVKGVMHGCRAVAKAMMDQRAGVIVNVSSLAGITPVPGMSLYSASKFAVRGYSLSLAFELTEYGVHVGVVCPDAVETPMLEAEVEYEEAALTFSGSTALSTDDVVDAIIEQIVDERKMMTAVPASRGMLAQLSGMMPDVTKRLLPIMRARGKKEQKKRSR